MSKYILSIVMLAVVCIALATRPRDKRESSSPLIRRDRPSIYIEFYKSGSAPPMFEGESRSRIWLRLTNNAHWSIAFCSFRVHQEYGEIGVVHEVGQLRTSAQGGKGGGLGRKESLQTRDSINSQGSVQLRSMPQGYTTGDTCSPYELASGKSVLFSIPREHLGKGLYVEIEFWPEWENQDNEIGSFPKYLVSFDHFQLPRNER